MVVGFADSVMNIIELDDMATRPTVIYADRSTWHVVYMVVADDIRFAYR